jgi:hypothetical protein
MKKSSIITILILVVLAVAAVFVYKSKGKNSTIDKEASDFGLKDTALVDKMFLADKDGKSVLLERKPEGWMLNGKYHARPDAIEMLLYTARMVEVKSPVSKASRETVIKLMAGKSTKVEFYIKGKKVKQYYIGHSTQDHTGTFMLMTNPETDENYKDPFITHIPGFNGYLSTRYFADEADWRDRMMINFRPPQIKQIKLDLHEFPDSSFVIDLFSMQRFGLKNGKGQQLPFEEEKIKQYIAYFQNVNCEVVMDKQMPLYDSISKSAVPFATLTITDRNNKPNVSQFYHKFPIADKNKEYGVDYNYDPDRLFVKYNNGVDYGVAQYFVFGKILQTYSYFIPQK